MKSTSLLAAAAAFLTAVSTAAAFPPSPIDPPTALLDSRYEHHAGRRPRGIKAHAHSGSSTIGNTTFDQQLDHSDFSKGTFGQRYWWDAQYYKGPGSPIFVFNPGETDAEDMVGYLDNDTIPGLYAQMFGGAVIVIEHRYWGKSIPFKQLTAETLQYHNLPNAMKDMTYFAKTVQLDFDTSTTGQANAPHSPWVLIGGSYSGALAAWTQQKEGGTFAAYHASSAVVEAVYDFWQYFVPVEHGLPRNCSADVKRVVAYVDKVLSTGTTADIQTLKEHFGLGNLAHIEDFAAELTTPVWKWQSNRTRVLQFCDYLELYSSGGKVIPGPEGVGLQAALPAYASWITHTAGATCQQYNCDTYTTPEKLFNLPADLSGDRQWQWLLCNEPFGWWQVGPAVSDGTGIVSSHLRPDYFQRQCDYYFPKTNGFAAGASLGFTADHHNMYTGGWASLFSKVLFVNGEFDPWKSATVSSEFKPGGPLNGTDDIPVFIVPNGNHVPEMIIYQNRPEQIAVVNQCLKVMDKWLKAFKPS